MNYYKLSTIILVILFILAVFYNSFIRYETNESIENISEKCIEALDNTVDNCYEYSCKLIDCTWTEEETEAIKEVCIEILMGNE